MTIKNISAWRPGPHLFLDPLLYVHLGSCEMSPRRGKQKTQVAIPAIRITQRKYRPLTELNGFGEINAFANKWVVFTKSPKFKQFSRAPDWE